MSLSNDLTLNLIYFIVIRSMNQGMGRGLVWIDLSSLSNIKGHKLRIINLMSFGIQQKGRNFFYFSLHHQNFKCNFSHSVCLQQKRVKSRYVIHVNSIQLILFFCIFVLDEFFLQTLSQSFIEFKTYALSIIHNICMNFEDIRELLYFYIPTIWRLEKQFYFSFFCI